MIKDGQGPEWSSLCTRVSQEQQEGDRETIWGNFQKNSDFLGGYLYNDWYKLRLERNGVDYINYSLNRSGIGLVDFKTTDTLGAQFQDLTKIEWTNSKNPMVCPIFFWDDHKIGLIN